MPRGRFAKSKEEKLLILEQNSIPEPTTGCWIWLGKLVGYHPGYPNGSGLGGGIHRWICSEVNGEDITGLYACHRCGHSWCVEPTHIYAGTAKQNTDDAKRHGTFELHLNGLRSRWATISSEEKDAHLGKLNTAMRAKWDSMSPEQRSDRARDSIKNIRKWEESLTPEEREAAFKKRGRGPSRFIEELKKDPVAFKKWTTERAKKSAAARIANRANSETLP